MKPSQVKAFLHEKKLTVSGIARKLQPEYPIGFQSLRVMVGDCLFSRRYFPRLAGLINEKFGLSLKRPPHLAPACPGRKKAKAAETGG